MIIYFIVLGAFATLHDHPTTVGVFRGFQIATVTMSLMPLVDALTSEVSVKPTCADVVVCEHVAHSRADDNAHRDRRTTTNAVDV